MFLIEFCSIRLIFLPGCIMQYEVKKFVKQFYVYNVLDVILEKEEVY